MNAIKREVSILKGNGVVLLDRVSTIEREYITQADIESITVTIYDRKGVAVGDPIDIDKTAYVKNTLQTDDWDQDAIGWNVEIPIPGSYFTTGDTHYTAVIKFVKADSEGDNLHVVWKIQVQDHPQDVSV